MAFEVEFTDEFGAWWNTLTPTEQDSVDFAVQLLESKGPMLGRPYADTLKGSKYPNLKELRTQSDGSPLRILFAFDPRRVALLLVGGNKSGNPRFYEESIATAESLYTQHLASLKP